MNKRSLKVRDAQVRLGVSRGKLYQMIRSGELPVVAISPRCFRIPEEALEQYIQRKLEEGWQG